MSRERGIGWELGRTTAVTSGQGQKKTSTASFLINLSLLWNNLWHVPSHICSVQPPKNCNITALLTNDPSTFQQEMNWIRRQNGNGYQQDSEWKTRFGKYNESKMNTNKRQHLDWPPNILLLIFARYVKRWQTVKAASTSHCHTAKDWSRRSCLGSDHRRLFLNT